MKVVRIPFIESLEAPGRIISQFVNPDHIQRINTVKGGDGNAYVEFFIGDAIMYARYEDFLTAHEENIFTVPS